GPEVEHAVEDEGEGEGVGADHPLAVHGDLAIASGDEGGERAEDPERDLDEDAGKVGAVTTAKLDEEGDGGGGEDGDDVDAAEDAVELQMAGSEAGGELDGAGDEGQRAGDGVRDEESAVVDELEAVGVVGRVVEGEEEFCGDEDEERGEAHEEPEGVLGGEAAARGRWRCRRQSGGGCSHEWASP